MNVNKHTGIYIYLEYIVDFKAQDANVNVVSDPLACIAVISSAPYSSASLVHCQTNASRDLQLWAGSLSPEKAHNTENAHTWRGILGGGYGNPSPVVWGGGNDLVGVPLGIVEFECRANAANKNTPTVPFRLFYLK